jgi:tripartite-type tricarboxylate transporter receptor subunit TctC
VRRDPAFCRRVEILEALMARMKSRLAASAGVLLARWCAPSTADDYPSKPVRIIIPYAPGGINDVAARVLSTHLTNRLGKQFVADNRTGAGGIVGFETAANAAPDGYTLVVISISNAVQPWLYKLPFDPAKAWEPVGMFVTSPNMLTIHPDVPAKTLREFIALAKAKPGDIQYASGGTGGSLHTGMEYFKMLAGVDLLHIPFRGAGPASIDVIAGNTKAIMSTVSSVSSHVRGGKLRALAVSAPQRVAAHPDVPTFIEAGLPDYVAGNWIGFAAPAGTPKAVIDKLHQEMLAVQDMADVQQQMINRGAQIERMGPAEFRAHIAKETEKWGRVVKEGNIKAE